MARYRFTGPDGKTFVVNAPEGATKEQAMAIARQHIAAMPKPPTEKRGILRRADDFVRGVADVATLGYADEIAAKMGSLTGLGGKRGDYEGNLARERQRDEAGGTERLAGQIAGAVALPTSRLSAGRGLAGVAGSALEGGLFGAAYGAGSAKEGQRLQGAKTGAMWGTGGGAVGRVAGNTISRALRGKQVTPAVRKLANEGVVMTPGRRGGAVARTYEEGLLGSIPFVKTVPAAANNRSIEQLNVATYNRVLKPIGQKLPMSTKPGHEAVSAVGSTVFQAYDDAAAALSLQMDDGISRTATGIKKGATATAGSNAAQLKAIVDETIAPLQSGPVTGERVRDILQDLRGTASAFRTSSTASDRRIGDQLWKLHDQLEISLVRQNKGDVLTPFKNARHAASLFKRVETAASKSPTGIFNPQQLWTAVTKRGYGTTTSKLSRNKAPLQDLAGAAKEVLPARLQNSGTPERVAGMAMLGGPPAIGAFVDPVVGAAASLPLGAYIPGIDRFLQYMALNRPGAFVKGGNAVSRASPHLAKAGAVTAYNKRRRLLPDEQR